MDLTEAGDTKGSLVNQDDARCIEVWNLVFIQFNANEDGTFRPLPACHVDTGMGFERACSIIEGTKGLTDFSKLPSNYDTGVFAPIFAKLTELTGKEYTSTVPKDGARSGLTDQEQIDVAFRVIGDHLRTVSFAVADGIEPGNAGRNYVIRNVLRRAVRFGRVLGFDADSTFLVQLVPALVGEFGDIFPELKNRRDKIEDILRTEEEQFNRTLDRGLKLFEDAAAQVGKGEHFPAATVVKLWETYGFPTDLTELLLDERELETDEAEVARLVDAHRNTGSEGQQSEVVSAVDIHTDVVTEFVGYESDECAAKIVEWVKKDGAHFAIVDRSPFYVEKGGQVGDTGTLTAGEDTVRVTAVLGIGDAVALQVEKKPKSRAKNVTLRVDPDRRRGIERHHTATHLFHWALHEVVSPDATQQGSLVAADRLRFDFNAKALAPEQIERIESEVNRCIHSDDPVSTVEIPHTDIRENPDIMQFFGDKYGDLVRVVQIGGQPTELDGYSMELCGGTHVKTTGEIGFFKIRSEGAVAAGIRRIEAVCGGAASELILDQAEATATETTEAEAKLAAVNEKLESIDEKTAEAEGDGKALEEIRNLLDDEKLLEADARLQKFQAYRDEVKALAVKADKAWKKVSAKAAASQAASWYAEELESLEGDAPLRFAGQLPGDSPALLQEAMNAVKARQFPGAAALALVEGENLHFGVIVHPDHTGEIKAGDIVREALAEAGGKGGGKPAMARGAAPGGAAHVDAVLTRARELMGA